MNHVAPIRRSYHRHEAAECGHGTCGARVDCTGECALKAAIVNLPVIDPQYLDSQIDSVRDMPIQYADDDLISEVTKAGGWFKRIALAIGAGILIALVIAVSSK